MSTIDMVVVILLGVVLWAFLIIVAIAVWNAAG